MQSSNIESRIRSAVSQKLDIKKDTSDEEIQNLITEVIFELSSESYIDLRQKQQHAKNVFNAMRRLGILQPVVDDKSVTEIMINGSDTIFIERDGRISKLDMIFDSSEMLEDIIQVIVAKANRTVNESVPIVDARLEDGSRVNVVLSPIALNGPVMTIRKFPEEPITMEQLIGFGSITEEASLFMKMLVEAKYNIFISGGTGSGKTTFLNVLSDFIPKDERIITIEDSAELRIRGVENIVSLETRNANTEGKGEISIRQLIRTSLRMRPERIIVGEVRGPEAFDMLQAMNTGHDGSISTGHANSCTDMISRLETMVLTAAPIPLEAVRKQISSAVDVIVHLSRMRDKSRKVLEVTEVLNVEEGEIRLNPLFTFEEDESGESVQVGGKLKRLDNALINTHKLKMSGLYGEYRRSYV